MKKPKRSKIEVRAAELSDVESLTRLFASRVAVIQDIDGVAFLLEAGLDETGDLSIVFYHQDAHVTSQSTSPPYKERGGTTRPGMPH